MDGGLISEQERIRREIINDIITLNEGLRQFWIKADGWTPIEAAQLLSKSRLDWQVSLSRCLKIWIEEPNPDDESGQLILVVPDN